LLFSAVRALCVEVAIIQRGIYKAYQSQSNLSRKKCEAHRFFHCHFLSSSQFSENRIIKLFFNFFATEMQSESPKDATYMVILSGN
jgi:hypothetical protein